MANEANSNGGKTKRNYGPKEPVTVSVSQILQWLEEGETRQDIQKKLGLNAGQLAALFQSSPKLRGKKTKKDLSKAFHLIDDVQENGTENAVSNSTANTQAAPSWE